MRAAPRLRRGKRSFSPRTWPGWIPVTSTGIRKSGKRRRVAESQQALTRGPAARPCLRPAAPIPRPRGQGAAPDSGRLRSIRTIRGNCLAEALVAFALDEFEEDRPITVREKICSRIFVMPPFTTPRHRSGCRVSSSGRSARGVREHADGTFHNRFPGPGMNFRPFAASLSVAS